MSAGVTRTCRERRPLLLPVQARVQMGNGHPSYVRCPYVRRLSSAPLHVLPLLLVVARLHSKLSDYSTKQRELILVPVLHKV
jgi:hypothetical protein